MPVNKECKYYRWKAEPLENREIRETKSKLEPRYITFEWCIHEKSPLRENEKGVLICQGDVKKCPIKSRKEAI